MGESGEPQVLSLRMRGFDEDELKHEIKEGGSVTSDDRDSPDSSSRYAMHVNVHTMFAIIIYDAPRPCLRIIIHFFIHFIVVLPQF